MSAVDLFVDRVGLQHPKRVLDTVQQTDLVLFYGQHIVGLFCDDLGRD